MFLFSDNDYNAWKALHILLCPILCKLPSEIEGQLGYGKRKGTSTHNYVKKHSKEDSLKSTILILQSGDFFKNEVLKLAQEKKKSHVPFHPIMGAFKKENNCLHNYVLFVNHIILEMTSFRELLKVFMMTFFVFQLEYPAEGRLACQFMALSLFGFEEDSTSPGWSKVKTLNEKFLLYDKNCELSENETSENDSVDILH